MRESRKLIYITAVINLILIVLLLINWTQPYGTKNPGVLIAYFMFFFQINMKIFLSLNSLNQ